MSTPPDEKNRSKPADDPDALPLKPLPWKARVIWAVVLVLLPAAIGHFFFQPHASSHAVSSAPLVENVEPFGKLMAPAAGSRVPRIFEIAGETRNIPADRQAIIVVDIPEHNLCWPKQPFIEANIPFKTEIFTGRHIGEITVSLYAVDPIYHRQIIDWFNSETPAGMWRLPRRYLLDTIRLDLDISAGSPGNPAGKG